MGGGAAASGGVHVVRPGENLSTIAARYGTPVAALAQANGIANPNHIYVGQRLTIVSGAGGTVANPAPQPAPVAPPVVSGQRWIDIDISAQTLTAYDGNTPVFNTLVSTGLAFPTPVGQYKILLQATVTTHDRPWLRSAQCAMGDVFYQPRPCHPWRLLAQQLWPSDKPRLCQHAA